MKAPGRNEYILVAALAFVAVSTALYNTYSLDYFGVHFAGDRFGMLVLGEISSGRYTNVAFLRLFQWIRLDLQDWYPLFVAATGVSAGLFLWELCQRYLRLNAGIWAFGAAAAAFLFSGPMLDLLSFREVIHHPLLVFLVGYAYLRAHEIPNRWLRAITQGAAAILMFGTYQPAAVMLFVLAVLKAMLDAEDDLPVWREFLTTCVMLLASAALYMVLKGGIERAFHLDVTRAMMDFHNGGSVKARVVAHTKALWALYNPAGTTYRWSHVNLALLAAMAWLAWHARNLAGAFFVALMVGVSQSPMNALLVDYWPSLRSSFYIGLIPPVVALYFMKHSNRRLPVYALALLWAFASASTLLAMHKVREQDALLAREIAAAVRGTGEPVKAMRMPADWNLIIKDYYPGRDNAPMDMGAPALYAPWTAAPFLRHETGLVLSYAGRIECAAPGPAPRVRVTVEDGVANVCYR
ncbi:hypothetical protein [Cupriavidus sp. DF5525]|uniref:hypothetical protein n=1 Tax=Cupriavidus sp. DF5525 TaxID=3160989 RepID=UPI0032DE9029